MAYSLETSSVKTIVPGAEVSGFCDVVARQKISALSSEVPQLSAGEGIDISFVDDKTVITNNISAGENISLVYDQETNTYRIDAASPDISAYTLTGAAGIDVSTDHVNRQTIVSYTGTMGDPEVNNVVHSYSAAGKWLTAHQSLSNYYQKTDTSSKQEISAALDYVSSNAGHTYTGVAPIQVNNTTSEISITGESLSAGPGIDMFSSGGYVVISANGGGGEGAIYNGISPIDVNNSTHQISAKGVSFGVQNPLFFVQDDNEAVIIGCSAGGGADNNYVKVITDSSATSQVTYGDLRALCEGHTEFDLFYDSTNRSRRYLYRCSKSYIDSTWCQVCFSTVPITDDHETDSELYGKQTNKVYDLEFIFWSVGDGGPSNDTIVYVGSDQVIAGTVNHNFAERSIQSDWNETDTKAQTYIKNKPDLTSFITSAQVSATLTGYQTKLDSVNNIVLTASLPATPDANTLYLITEA